MEQFIFPFGQVEKGSNVVIYGAGDVGKVFVGQLKGTKYANIMLWVDKRYEVYKGMGLDISAPDVIKTVIFDYIVIAVLNPAISEEIRKNLIEMNIPTSKIIWSSEYEIKFSHKYANADEEYRRSLADSEILERIPALQLVSSKRLDVLLRYLLCKDILNGICNEETLNLYRRFILIENGGEEYIKKGTISEYFVDYESKVGLDSFIDSFKRLIASMKEGGFLKEKFVALDEDRQIINASHRTAAALALEEDVWARKYKEFGTRAQVWDHQWFEKQGFSEEDMLRLLRAYSDLYSGCGIIVLMGTCYDEWSFLLAQLGRKFNIVGKADIDFEDNFQGFTNLLYEFNQMGICVDKSSLLMHILCFRVVLVSDEGGYDGNFYNDLKDFAMRQQRAYEEIYGNTNYIIWSDNKSMFSRLKELLLSPNNIRLLKQRFVGVASENLNCRIKEFRNFLRENGIDESKVCLNGDTVLEILGLKETERISFLPETSVREEIEKLLSNRFNDFEMSYKNWTRIGTNAVFDDDVIINDWNLYFIYDGLKCLNPLLLKATMELRKESVNNKLERRLLELFFEYEYNFQSGYYKKCRFNMEIDRQRLHGSWNL